MNTHLIGLDLAWSSRNNSAAVALMAVGDEARWVDHCERLGHNDEILSFVRRVAKDRPALLAIDAPLVVPNANGARPVDREITRLFDRYEAGCYPANRNRPGGGTRGEEIVDALLQEGFQQNPYFDQQAPVHSVFEVYPHPATISLFRLAKTLKYKARSKRSTAFRRKELARLRQYLMDLTHAQPAMSTKASVANRDIDALRGQALKCYEDLLDATICAYIAFYAWFWGPSRSEVYGDTAHGYVLIPMTKWMRKRLAQETATTSV